MHFIKLERRYTSIFDFQQLNQDFNISGRKVKSSDYIFLGNSQGNVSSWQIASAFGRADSIPMQLWSFMSSAQISLYGQQNQFETSLGALLIFIMFVYIQITEV